MNIGNQHSWQPRTQQTCIRTALDSCLDSSLLMTCTVGGHGLGDVIFFLGNREIAKTSKIRGCGKNSRDQVRLFDDASHQSDDCPESAEATVGSGSPTCTRRVHEWWRSGSSLKLKPNNQYHSTLVPSRNLFYAEQVWNWKKNLNLLTETRHLSASRQRGPLDCEGLLRLTSP